MTEKDEWDHHYASGLGWRPVSHTEVAALTARLGPTAPGARALDIGCGLGHLAARLSDHGYHVDGIDWSASAIEQARTLERPGLRFHAADLEDPGLQPGYTLITARLVYPVINDQAALLRTAARLLKPGGRLVVSAQQADELPEKRRHIGFSAEHLAQLEDWADDIDEYKHEGLLVVLCTRTAAKNAREA